jgi:hypothetical protein
VLKLRCNKRSAYTETDPSLLEEEIPLRNTFLSRRDQRLGHGSRVD